jgi:hypothetical protein
VRAWFERMAAELATGAPIGVGAASP